MSSHKRVKAKNQISLKKKRSNLTILK